jgi:hypothetical protein
MNDICTLQMTPSNNPLTETEKDSSFRLEGPPVLLAPLLETEIQDYMWTAKQGRGRPHLPPSQASTSLHMDLMVCPEFRRSQEELGNYCQTNFILLL